MSRKVFLVHGWSVKETSTYQALHVKLAENGFAPHDVHLGRYVSLEDTVEIRDVSRALHRALRRELGANWNQAFHIITHSTGALVVRDWIVRHYTGKYSAARALKNVIFLAGPHFGSRLAHHGRSMLAQARYLGDTGKQLLTALELGSAFSWTLAEQWADSSNWKKKGIRPFNLVGDRVEKDYFKSKIMPAAYEAGSDMVVRAAAANLNFSRFELTARDRKLRRVGGIDGVPFGALWGYVHSGPDHGIMNSIKENSSRENQNLRLILDCLGVRNSAQHANMREILNQATGETRERRKGFAQLDFRFRDEDGQPVDDYAFKLGAVVAGKAKPSKTVVHTHKNKVDPSHFTVFLDMKHLEPQLVYFMEFDSRSGSDLFSFEPDPLVVEAPAGKISSIISQDRTTQIDVVMSRVPHRNLFVFHTGDDAALHVKWNRAGDVTKTQIPVAVE